MLPVWRRCNIHVRRPEGLPGRRPLRAQRRHLQPRAAHRPGYELTLIAAEVVEELTAREATLDFARPAATS